MYLPPFSSDLTQNITCCVAAFPEVSGCLDMRITELWRARTSQRYKAAHPSSFWMEWTAPRAHKGLSVTHIPAEPLGDFILQIYRVLPEISGAALNLPALQASALIFTHNLFFKFNSWRHSCMPEQPFIIQNVHGAAQVEFSVLTYFIFSGDWGWKGKKWGVEML